MRGWRAGVDGRLGGREHSQVPPPLLRGSEVSASVQAWLTGRGGHPHPHPQPRTTGSGERAGRRQSQFKNQSRTSSWPSSPRPWKNAWPCALLSTGHSSTAVPPITWASCPGAPGKTLTAPDLFWKTQGGREQQGYRDGAGQGVARVPTLTHQ